MTTPIAKIAAIALGFVLVLVSGFWLSRSGKPYGFLPFNLHKLIGLAILVTLIVMTYKAYKLGGLGGVEVASIVAVGVFFVGVFVSGGLLSIGKPMPSFVSIIHKSFPYLTILSTGCLIYLMVFRRS